MKALCPCGKTHAAKTIVDRHAKSGGQGQGMNWIRPVKRLAIYLRDGMACAYCGEGVEAGAKLTLDHILPHSLGGCNSEKNLITACHKCNSSRGNRDLAEFAEKVAGYLNHGVTGAMILEHIQATSAKALDTKAAQALIDARGGFTAAMKS